MNAYLRMLLDDKGHDIYSISPEAGVTECAVTMKKLNVGALLVIDRGELVGLISERDIARSFFSFDCHSKAIVKNLMTENPITVTPTTTVNEAMKIVTEKRIRHLPVISDGELVGMISIGDLTRWVMLEQENEIQQLTKYIHGDGPG